MPATSSFPGRATKFHQTSVVRASDLASLLQHDFPDNPVVSALVDGRPDFNLGHLKNMIALGRLWHDFALDCLMVTCAYALGQSVYNPLERAWAVLANTLTSITLPNYLPGEPPPEEQTLSEDEKQRKESVVFDLDIDQLCGY